MIYLYIIILMFLSWGLSFISGRLPERYLNVILGVFSFLMIIISATRPDTGVSDMVNYEDMFLNYDSLKYQLSVEPTYLWLSRVIQSFGGGFRIILWVFAIIAIPVKMYAFKRMSSYEIFYAALPVYLSFFFLMHDCEQIRIAAAATFIMMAYVYRIEGRKWYVWIPLWICAIFFHYSSAVGIVPLILYTSKRMTWKTRMALGILVIMGVVIWVLKFNIFSIIPIPGLEVKMALYELSISKGDQLESILLYSPVALLRYITFFYALCFYDLMRPHIKGLNIILVSNAIGLFAWGGLSGIAVFAVRISEFFQITESILFAAVFLTIRPQWVGKLYPIVTGTFLLLYGMMINQFGYI